MKTTITLPSVEDLVGAATKVMVRKKFIEGFQKEATKYISGMEYTVAELTHRELRNLLAKVWGAAEKVGKKKGMNEAAKLTKEEVKNLYKETIRSYARAQAENLFTYAVERGAESVINNAIRRHIKNDEKMREALATAISRQLKNTLHIEATYKRAVEEKVNKLYRGSIDRLVKAINKIAEEKG